MSPEQLQTHSSIVYLAYTGGGGKHIYNSLFGSGENEINPERLLFSARVLNSTLGVLMTGGGENSSNFVMVLDIWHSRYSYTYYRLASEIMQSSTTSYIAQEVTWYTKRWCAHKETPQYHDTNGDLETHAATPRRQNSSAFPQLIVWPGAQKSNIDSPYVHEIPTGTLGDPHHENYAALPPRLLRAAHLRTKNNKNVRTEAQYVRTHRDTQTANEHLVRHPHLLFQHYIELRIAVSFLLKSIYPFRPLLLPGTSIVRPASLLSTLFHAFSAMRTGRPTGSVSPLSKYLRPFGRMASETWTGSSFLQGRKLNCCSRRFFSKNRHMISRALLHIFIF